MRTARGTFTIPGRLTLDEVDSLIEKVRESAYPVQTAPRTLQVTWEAEDDWALRGIVEETLADIESNWSIPVTADDIVREDKP